MPGSPGNALRGHFRGLRGREGDAQLKPRAGGAPPPQVSARREGQGCAGTDPAPVPASSLRCGRFAGLGFLKVSGSGAANCSAPRAASPAASGGPRGLVSSVQLSSARAGHARRQRGAAGVGRSRRPLSLPVCEMGREALAAPSGGGGRGCANGQVPKSEFPAARLGPPPLLSPGGSRGCTCGRDRAQGARRCGGGSYRHPHPTSPPLLSLPPQLVTLPRRRAVTERAVPLPGAGVRVTSRPPPCLPPPSSGGWVGGARGRGGGAH